MIRWIIGTGLGFRFLVVVLAVVVMVSGVYQVRQMPVDYLPEFSPPYVEIQIEALGLSAEEVEQMITVPMEQDLLAGVAWLDIIRSESVPGLSSIVVYFEPGTDIYRARQMISERIAQSAVALPHVSKPPTMIQPLSSASRFMIVGLSSKDLSLIQMSVLARWVIAPRLMGVPGVAHVAIWGERDWQLQVQVNPEKLTAQGVTLQQVINTTGNALWVSPLTYLEASSPGTGGFIDTPNQRLGIWHVLPITSPADLEQVAVEGATGLRLGDVTKVVEDHQPLIGDAIVNDNPNLLLVIEKLPEINTLEVSRGVDEAIAALKPGMTNVNFDASVFRPATFLEMAINNLGRSLIIGALLVVFLLFALLYDWRITLIGIASISVSIIAALLVLYTRGMTMNALVFAGLVAALGVIFDDAIGDIEHIARRVRLQNREDSRPMPSVVLDAAQEMRSPLFLAALITTLFVVPVFFVQGATGALFQPMALAYVWAVLISLVVALVLTPALALILLPAGPLALRESPVAAWLKHGYENALAWMISRPRLAYIVLAVLLITCLAVAPFLKPGSFIPPFQEPYLIVQVSGAPATSHPEMSRIVARMSSELRTVAGVRNVGAVVGRAIYGDQTVGVNSAQLLVAIDPRANFASTTAAVRDVVDGYAGMNRQVYTYMEQVISQPKNTTEDGASVRIFGEEEAILKSEAEKLQPILAKINGVVDPQVVLPVEEPTLEIEVNLDTAKNYGIKPGDARRAAATLLAGIQVGSLFEEQKVFDVVVWGSPEVRNDLSDIKDLMVEMPGGGTVRLGDVANVRLVSAPTVIRREAASPYMDIHFGIAGRDPQSVIRDVHAVLQGYSFPLEYHAELREGYTAQQSTFQGLAYSGLIALLGVFLLLQAASSNWKFAALTLLTFPAALAGGLLAAFIVGGGITISVLAGLVTLLGITVRGTVMEASHYHQLEKQEGEAFGPALILRGAKERLTPTLTTVLALILVLLPFVIFGGIPGQEIVFPMAVVILGGLVTTVVVNLFVVPALYMLSAPSHEPELVFEPAPAADQA